MCIRDRDLWVTAKPFFEKWARENNSVSAFLRKISKNKIKVTSAVIQIGNEKIENSTWNNNFINKNPFFSPDKSILKKWEELILTHRKKGSSLGAVIEVRVSNCPVGIGEPIYQKLDSELSKAIMSLSLIHI